MQVTLTSKGQITLPKALRTALGLEAGDKIRFLPDGHGGVLLKPSKTGTLAQLKGCLPKPNQPMSDTKIDAEIANYLIKKHSIRQKDAP